MKEYPTREQLLRLSKKQILNILGCQNIKDYYRQTGDIGKISKKYLISLLVN